MQLHLPTPCPESWDAMTPAPGGRHCAACQQVVIDFTAFTDGELAAYLGQSGKLPCGRFRESQLNRVLLPAAAPVAGWRRWLGAAAAVLGLGALATPSRAQTVPGSPTAAQASSPGEHPPATPAAAQQPGALPAQADYPEHMLLGAPLRQRAHPERILSGAPRKMPPHPAPKAQHLRP